MTSRTYLRPGDVLVANQTRVIPARLVARKDPTGGRVELLLLSRLDALRWEALVKGRRAEPGQRLAIGEGSDRIGGLIEAVTPGGGRLIAFEQPIDEHLDRLGETPLPPYIHETLERRGTLPDRLRRHSRVPSPPRLPVSILPPNCSNGSGAWASSGKRCCSTSGWIPFAP